MPPVYATIASYPTWSPAIRAVRKDNMIGRTPRCGADPKTALCNSEPIEHQPQTHGRQWNLFPRRCKPCSPSARRVVDVAPICLGECERVNGSMLATSGRPIGIGRSAGSSFDGSMSIASTGMPAIARACSISISIRATTPGNRRSATEKLSVRSERQISSRFSSR